MKGAAPCGKCGAGAMPNLSWVQKYTVEENFEMESRSN
jgi:hypothetical protein